MTMQPKTIEISRKGYVTSYGFYTASHWDANLLGDASFAFLRNVPIATHVDIHADETCVELVKPSKYTRMAVNSKD